MMGRLTITSIFDELSTKYLEAEQQSYEALQFTDEEVNERMKKNRLYVNNARDMLQDNLNELWTPERQRKHIKEAMRSDIKNAKRGI